MLKKKLLGFYADEVDVKLISTALDQLLYTFEVSSSLGDFDGLSPEQKWELPELVDRVKAMAECFEKFDGNFAKSERRKR